MPPSQIDWICFIPMIGSASPQVHSTVAAQKTIDALRASMDERRKGAVLAIAEHQFTKGVLAHLWIRGERDSLGRFEANILTAITAVANASGYDVTFAPTQSAECGALSPIQSQEKGTSHG